MPPRIPYELLDRLKDRYEPLELLELIAPSMEEVVDTFEDKLADLLEKGVLDVF